VGFQPNVIDTTVHKISSPYSESPDWKIVSGTDSLLTRTPTQSAPERLVLGSDVKIQKMTGQKSTSCFKPAKRVLDFSLTEGGDDLDNRVDMSKPSRGCSEDFKSFDLFPYFRRYAHFGPFHLLPFVKKDKKINLSSPENSSVFHVKF
jgi:hypothetical protein